MKYVINTTATLETTTYTTAEIHRGLGDNVTCWAPVIDAADGHIGRVKIRLRSWSRRDGKQPFSAIQFDVMGVTYNVTMPVAAIEKLTIIKKPGFFDTIQIDPTPWGRQIFADKFSEEQMKRVKGIANGLIDLAKEAVGL